MSIISPVTAELQKPVPYLRRLIDMPMKNLHGFYYLQKVPVPGYEYEGLVRAKAFALCGDVWHDRIRNGEKITDGCKNHPAENLHMEGAKHEPE